MSFINLCLNAESQHGAVHVFFDLQKYNFVLHLKLLISLIPSIMLYLTLFLI